MRRRKFITLLGGAAAAWPVVVRAQQSQRMKRVAVLLTGTPDTHRAYLAAIRNRIAELGYVEGQTVTLDVAWADGRVDRIAPLIAELIQRNPDVIIAPTTTAVLAVRRTGASVPTVFITVADPIGSGIVESYAHPGGTATGIQGNIDSLPGKQIELIREIVPTVTKVGMLINKLNPSTLGQKRNAESAAAVLGVTLVPVEISTAADLGAAFDELARGKAQAVLCPTDSTMSAARKQVADLALAARLPSVFPYREHVEAGGLISYGVDLRESHRHAIDFVDKILKGAKPGDLPVEFPTRLSMVINLRTAKAVGLSIPESFLLRADEVIE